METNKQSANGNQHTPTPWKAVDVRSTERGKRGIVYYQIKQGNGAKASIGFAGVYEGKNPAADAAFIVKACNLHDELIAALKAYADYHDTDYEELPETKCARALLRRDGES